MMKSSIENNNEVPKNVSDFCEIVANMAELYEKKNHDYGDAYSEVYSMLKELGNDYANGYALGTLIVKVMRIKTLLKEKAQVEGESMIDSLNDLANYAVMFQMVINNG